MQDSFVEDVVALLPNLKRFALSLCRRPDVADDLVQITAERAFRARHQFDPATRLEAWLFRILRNAWIDMLRRDRTRGETVDIHDSPQADPVGRAVNSAAGTASLAGSPKAARTVFKPSCHHVTHCDISTFAHSIHSAAIRETDRPVPDVARGGPVFR